jgi:YfiH family protein
MFPIAAGLVRPTSAGGRPSSWAATGRSGGVSRPPYDTLNLAGYVGDDDGAVASNRSTLARALGASDSRLAVMDAVHGADVAIVDEPGVVDGVDALVTQAPGLAIAALGADCVPVALIGDDGLTVGVAHCGWRGLVIDVVHSVVSAVRDHGCDISTVILGPAVCGTCYPVPPDRADEVVRRCSGPVSAAAVTRCADGQPGIDVRLGVRARLVELGLDPGVIMTAGGCTVEDPALFSFRRDGITGRQGIGVCLAPDDLARMGTS